MRKIYTFIFVLVLGSLNGFSQTTTIFSENMGSPSGTTTIASNTFQNSGTLTYSNGGTTSSADVRISSASSTSNYANASGGGNVFFTTTSGNHGFAIEGINASNYTDLKVDFAYRKESSSALPVFALDFWNGTAWVNVPFTLTQAANATATWYLITGISLPAGAQINGLKLRWSKTGTNSFRIDDVRLYGTAAGTSVSTGGVTSISSFTYVEGAGPSTSQSFTASGTNLTGDVTVTPSNTNFEIATAAAGPYQTTPITLAPVSGNVSQAIFVRLVAGLSIGGSPYTGNITVSSTGATNAVVNLSGTVTATPSLSAAPASLSGFSTTQGIESAAQTFTVTGSNLTGNVTVTAPADYEVSLAANSGYNTSVTITPASGTVAGTTVYVRIRNTAAVGSPAGNVTVAATGVTTQNVAVSGTVAAAPVTPEGLQIAAVNTAYTVNFDNTFANVNNGQLNFTTSVWGSNPAGTGQVFSTAWAYNAGSSTAASTFGGNLGGAFSTTTGGVTTSGGVYAFEVASGNRALGLQPTGSVFGNGGNFTLRLQNQTGATITAADILYKIYVYNDQDRSTTFNFSYSTDNATYTQVAAANFSTPLTGETTPAWAVTNRTVNLSGISVAPGGFLYIRWFGADNGGTGSRDEIALDDITVTANPQINAPLPVLFTNVRAAQQGSAIRVTWTNSSESEVVRYEVERSSNGRNFTKLAEVLPSKNDGGRADYLATDATPISGDNIYRIKSVESNGKITYSAIARVNTRGGQTVLNLFPNPAKGTDLSVQLTSLPAGKYSLRVVGGNGQVLLQRQINHNGGSLSETLPVAGLAGGVYTVQVAGPVQLQKSLLIQ